MSPQEIRARLAAITQRASQWGELPAKETPPASNGSPEASNADAGAQTEANTPTSTNPQFNPQLSPQPELVLEPPLELFLELPL